MLVIDGFVLTKDLLVTGTIGHNFNTDFKNLVLDKENINTKD